MSIYESNEDIPTNKEAYYEKIASQEEIYLEETEEEVAEVLIFEVPSPPQNADRDAESLDEILAEAAAELITGDADDPPLSQETITDLLSTSTTIRALTPLQESF